MADKNDKKLIDPKEHEKRVQKTIALLSENISLNEKMAEEYIALANKEKPSKQEKERQNELLTDLIKAYGLKNGFWASNISYEKDSKFLATTRESLVKEYDCKAPIELMMADRIVASYWRTMRLDLILNRLLVAEDGTFSFNDQKMTMVRELSKGLESASRQFNASILLLKELKQPKMNVKVNTENAFISQNQQFNVGKTNDQPSHETIDPK